MYRAVTLAALRERTPMTDQAMGELAASLEIVLEASSSGQRVVMNAEDVTAAIRGADVTGNVSQVSAFPLVRRALVQRQRMLGLHGGIVMDGRDIGSVVFPHAEVKVYLIADTNERVQRRLKEATARGEHISEEDVRRQIVDRDAYDSSRAESPLVKAEGAHEIDTTHLTIDEQVEKILELADTYQKTYSIVSAFGNFI
jgi:cytidylate kinase